MYSRIKALWKERGSPVNHVVQFTIAEGGGATTISGSLPELDNNTALKRILQSKQTVAKHISFQIREGVTLGLSVQRDPSPNTPMGTDALALSIADVAQPDHVAAILAEVRKRLPPFATSSGLSTALGPELEEFYRRREGSVQQIEAALARLVDEAVAFRRSLDDRAQEERVALFAEVDAERERLRQEIEARNTELTERETQLAAQRKDLDDRSNTHARRELLRDLRSKFEARSASFKLTPETETKRSAVLAGFVVLIIASALFAVYSVGTSFEALRAGTTVPAAERWLLAGRAFLSAAALIGASVFYIRWADSWTERHAAEEFKLKRLELDMDRASWVVEMALEWKDAKGSQIPPELLIQLTRNLFEDGPADRRVLHPAEDLASMVLGATSSLRVGIPGLGEATLDRKGMRQLQQSARAATDGDR